MSQDPNPNKHRSSQLGIPRLLHLIGLEKLSVVLPVKVTPSLTEYIRQHGGSAWIRESIIMRLRREERWSMERRFIYG